MDDFDDNGRALIDSAGRRLRPHCEVIRETPEQERECVRRDGGDLAVLRGEREGCFRGGLTFVCGRVREDELCALCGRLSDVLCDWPDHGSTCDLPMCRGCAASIAREVDLCPVHREAFGRIGGMPR